MAVSGSRGASSSNSAAAAAAAAARQRALEAARRAAEAARRAAEAARKAAEAARQAAAQAAKQAAAAQKSLAAASAEAKTAKGPERKPAEAKVETARKSFAGAEQKAKVAQQALQRAEEAVAKAAKKAESEMHAANAAAAKEGAAAPYSSQEIARTGMRTNELRDAFVGSGRRRDDLAKTLGIAASSSAGDLAQSVKASRDFERLAQDPAISTELDRLKIGSGEDLRAFGQRLARLADGGEARAGDAPLRGTTSRSALQTLIQTAGGALEGSAAELVSSERFARLVAAGREPAQVASMSPEDLAVDVYRTELEGSVQKPLSEWTNADADRFTYDLADQVEEHRDNPEMVEALLTLSGPRLQRSAQLLGEATEHKGERSEVEGMAANFSRMGNAAPPKAAAQLAYALASEIPDDSEQHYVDDGFNRFIEGGGDARFRDLVAGALATQGKQDAAEEMVTEGGGGLFSDPIGFIQDRFEDLTGAVGDVAGFFGGLAEKAAGEVYSFVSDQVVGRLGDAVRNAAAEAMNLDEQIARLESPGDSFVATANIEGNLLGVQVGAGVEIKISKTEEGYSMQLSGEGSAALAQKLNLPGLGDAQLEGEATASATLNFDFEDAAQITRAAETVAGVAVGVAATTAGGPLAPVGLAMVASAGDEISEIGRAYTSTTLQLEVRGSIGAELGAQLGLPGASANASVAGAIAIEIPRDGTPQLVLRQSLEVDGSLDISGAVPLPSGGTLSGGRVSGSASIELETRVPIDLDLGRIVSNPVGALREAGQEAIDGAETTLSGNLEFARGIGVEGPVTLSRDEGLQVKLSATANTRDLVGSLGMALSGDLGGALRRLGEDVTIEGSVSAFTESEAGIGSASERVDGDANREVDGEGVSVPGLGSLEVTAAVASRTSRVLTDFEGTPNDFLRDFGALVDGVGFQQEEREAA